MEREYVVKKHDSQLKPQNNKFIDFQLTRALHTKKNESKVVMGSTNIYNFYVSGT